MMLPPSQQSDLPPWKFTDTYLKITDLEIQSPDTIFISCHIVCRAKAPDRHKKGSNCLNWWVWLFRVGVAPDVLMKSTRWSSQGSSGSSQCIRREPLITLINMLEPLITDIWHTNMYTSKLWHELVILQDIIIKKREKRIKLSTTDSHVVFLEPLETTYTLLLSPHVIMAHK